MADGPAVAGDSRPIGVFDSGLGGLSVLREVRALLPAEDLLYVADSRFVPYGGRSPDAIRERAECLTRFLVEEGAKAIVVACNTATACAVTRLRTHWPVPVVGMEPAIKPAVHETRAGIVGVLATEGTLASGRFAALLEQYAGACRVITQPCPGLVEAVEAGELRGPRIEGLLARYVTPLLDAGADALILGCTHYPFLRPALAAFAGDHVRIIDTGEAVARQLVRRLDFDGLHAPPGRRGEAAFWTTGDPVAGGEALQRLWDAGARLQHLRSAEA